MKDDLRSRRCTWGILLGLLLVFAGSLGPVGAAFLHVMILFLGGMMILFGCINFPFWKR